MEAIIKTIKCNRSKTSLADAFRKALKKKEAQHA